MNKQDDFLLCFIRSTAVCTYTYIQYKNKPETCGGGLCSFFVKRKLSPSYMSTVPYQEHLSE